METHMIQEIDLQALTICRSMGFLEQEPDPMILERTQQLLEEAMQIAVPAFHYEVKDSVVLADDTVYIEDKAFRTGKTITRLLAGTTRLVLFVATGEWLSNIGWMRSRNKVTDWIHSLPIRLAVVWWVLVRNKWKQR